MGDSNLPTTIVADYDSSLTEVSLPILPQALSLKNILAVCLCFLLVVFLLAQLLSIPLMAASKGANICANIYASVCANGRVVSRWIGTVAAPCCIVYLSLILSVYLLYMLWVVQKTLMVSLKHVKSATEYVSTLQNVYRTKLNELFSGTMTQLMGDDSVKYNEPEGLEPEDIVAGGNEGMDNEPEGEIVVDASLEPEDIVAGGDPHHTHEIMDTCFLCKFPLGLPPTVWTKPVVDVCCASLRCTHSGCTKVFCETCLIGRHGNERDHRYINGPDQFKCRFCTENAQFIYVPEEHCVPTNDMAAKWSFLFWVVKELDNRPPTNNLAMPGYSLKNVHDRMEGIIQIEPEHVRTDRTWQNRINNFKSTLKSRYENAKKSIAE